MTGSFKIRSVTATLCPACPKKKGPAEAVYLQNPAFISAQQDWLPNPDLPPLYGILCKTVAQNP